MAGNNFLQWNSGAVNQDTDEEYALETQRVSGAVSGLFPSKLANKLFYQCTIMVAGLGEMMKGKGFTMSDADFSALITELSHILTDAQFGSTAGTVCQGNDPRLDRELPTATKVWFWQDTAPTGWTIDVTAAADAVLAVKSGSGTYAVSGGSQAGTWTQPSHTHTGGSHTHTISNHTHSFTGVDHLHFVPDHTLTIAEMPSHNHHTIFWRDRSSGASGNAVLGDENYYGSQTEYTNSVGGSKAHNHGNTGAADRSLAGTTEAGGAQTSSASGTETTSASATTNTWRPVANVGIICSRNA